MRRPPLWLHTGVNLCLPWSRFGSPNKWLFKMVQRHCYPLGNHSWGLHNLLSWERHSDLHSGALCSECFFFPLQGNLSRKSSGFPDPFLWENSNPTYSYSCRPPWGLGSDSTGARTQASNLRSCSSHSQSAEIRSKGITVERISQNQDEGMLCVLTGVDTIWQNHKKRNRHTYLHTHGGRGGAEHETHVKMVETMPDSWLVLLYNCNVIYEAWERLVKDPPDLPGLLFITTWEPSLQHFKYWDTSSVTLYGQSQMPSQGVYWTERRCVSCLAINTQGRPPEEELLPEVNMSLSVWQGGGWAKMHLPGSTWDLQVPLQNLITDEKQTIVSSDALTSVSTGRDIPDPQWVSETRDSTLPCTQRLRSPIW